MPDRLPVRSPPTTDDPIIDSSIHGIVLAAGISSRYGPENKLLQEIDGVPIVRQAVESLLVAGLDEVVVIVGHESDAVREVLEDVDIRICENETYKAGQSTSVREGIRATAERDADAVLIALGDMPFVSPMSVRILLTAYERWEVSALAAAYNGRRGNPVLFDAGHIDALTDLCGDVGGLEILLAADDAVLVETDDPGVLRDVDEPADIPEGEN